MTSRPLARVLVIAGSDSGGGAGIQADIKTITALGGYAMTAITAVTAQNTVGISGIFPVPAEFVARQISTVADDIGVDAIKIGMLGNAEVVRAVAEALDSPALSGIPLVLDPVMAATAGGSLLDEAGIAALIDRLLPKATLLTPNIPEAAKLTGLIIEDCETMALAARNLLALGARNVLIKGGHLPGDALTDMLLGADGRHAFDHPRISWRGTHGTGCVLGSAIATALGQGMCMRDAVAVGVDYVQSALSNAPPLGRGNGPLGVGSAKAC